jgi:TRAP transporter TAXI family solute receptor
MNVIENRGPTANSSHRGRGLARLAAIGCALWSLVGPAAAQDAPAPRNAPPAAMRRNLDVNSGTLGVISGGADGTYIRVAADLATVLDSDQMRILPIIGRGSLQNMKDIMFLRGVDIGIVQMDAREGLRAEGLQDQVVQRLRYITRLYNEEVHILANRSIADIRQLQGKKVNIDKPGSGTNLTSRLIFEKLGIAPELVTLDQASSYERLRSGEIDAAIYVAGRPVRAISEFQGDGRFHLLAIPFEGEIAETYFPAKFTRTDYPRLVDEGQDVETLAVGSILAVFNWPENSDRYRRVQRFVNAFFSRFDEFMQPGRHPKWREVTLTADVPGWQRIKAAQDWIDAARTGSVASAGSADFSAFMESRGISPTDRERLFRDFLVWQRERRRVRTGVAR